MLLLNLLKNHDLQISAKRNISAIWLHPSPTHRFSPETVDRLGILVRVGYLESADGLVALPDLHQEALEGIAPGDGDLDLVAGLHLFVADGDRVREAGGLRRRRMLRCHVLADRLRGATAVSESATGHGEDGEDGQRSHAGRRKRRCGFCVDDRTILQDFGNWSSL